MNYTAPPLSPEMTRATRYRAIANEIAETVIKKQAAYGDSFGKSGKVMEILYPEGIPAKALDDALTIVRVLDKLFRIATDRDALGESPWRDCLGYALLAVERIEGGRANFDPTPLPDRSSHSTSCGCDKCEKYWADKIAVPPVASPENVIPSDDMIGNAGHSSKRAVQEHTNKYGVLKGDK